MVSLPLLPINIIILVALLLTLPLHANAMALDTAAPATTVVVSGACGKVGSRLLRELLMNNNDGTKRIVALVRDANKLKAMMKDARYGEVDSTNLSIKEADYANPGQLKDAFATVHPSGDCRLFLSCGNVPDQAGLELNILKEAVAHTRGTNSNLFTAKLSTATPIMEANGGEGASSYAKEHRIVEDYLRANCDGNYCILRPNMFMQVLTAGSFLGINIPHVDKDEGELQATHPMANCKVSMIDCVDVASVAAHILSSANPNEQYGNNVYELTGPSAIGIREEIASAISNELKRPLEIENISLESALESNGIPSAAAKGLRPFLDTLGAYDRVTSQVEQLLGRPARSIHDFVPDEKWAI
uniref:NmrA-like domain-containing protein n=1 Tax=Minutocellus polymorphus TaxID=265543 RepID=A0A7S0FFZ2_9STRA|eukprot:CAMPEP_0197726600 /NCGR_PEP_ID=MMETSP1434-20131217/16373_1 /TAXON_ID=265543 /ORGANISM="Minutocellus polymorphus, Strain CCMP3303" /LENGTH=358 /DNA_ID=CAMNT_0043312583 /DNA_START=34 /DNA_END=1110 /DNA_ORIENTATION=+